VASNLDYSEMADDELREAYIAMLKRIEATTTAAESQRLRLAAMADELHVRSFRLRLERY
jgi:hypothetical protein